MLWESETEYPGVVKFAQGMKEALMHAHNAIIEAYVGQAKQANKHRRPATFKVNDLVYLSTKNLRIPKGRACKLIPKFIGPFRIAKVITKGATYRLDLSAELWSHRVHNAFHASLLRPHWPNDDRWFPGRQLHQLPGFMETPSEWAVNQILSHSGKGEDTTFELQWSTGDVTWAPLNEVKHLQVFMEYCEAQSLTWVAGTRGATLTIASMMLGAGTMGRPIMSSLGGYKLNRNGEVDQQLTYHPETGSLHTLHTHLPPYPPRPLIPIMDMNHTTDIRYTAEQWIGWKKYAKDLMAFIQHKGTFPGKPPVGYVEVYRKRQIFMPILDEHHMLICEYYGQAQPASTVGEVHMPASLLSKIVAKLHDNLAPAHPPQRVIYMGGNGGVRQYHQWGHGSVVFLE
ncbi:hypothetical protein AZE42_13313 [Rhizopogon vesiculosus]|uniref:Tf2-1-like SH3-like domain-containing protein n=1 Tax=Rhizopogon vesiculosus TaxID=180088 RepID=A0A1J8QD56_9AGAM|nr:hypothetical protein AZE42_13313 [Rhizopogon vesiculosus]